MQRFDIINRLIKTRQYTRYLEIGVLGKEAFNAVQCEFKDSVDPNGNAVFNMTSDAYFAMIGDTPGKYYDIVFIDGLHVADQVARDISNSLKHLSYGGIIVMHDCLPASEEEQASDPPGGRPWTGTAWHAFANLRRTRSDLSMCVVDVDHGCGIIEYGFQELWKEDPVLTWDYFTKNRDSLMNVISPSDFVSRYT